MSSGWGIRLSDIECSKTDILRAQMNMNSTDIAHAIDRSSKNHPKYLKNPPEYGKIGHPQLRIRKSNSS